MAVREALEAFMAADDAVPVLEAFEALLAAAGVSRDDVAGADAADADAGAASATTAAAATSGDGAAAPTAVPFFDRLRAAVEPAVIFKRKQLFKLLSTARDRARASGVVDAGTTSRVVVSGAGPVGLRSAVEAALLGHAVTVLEKRDSFSRHNIIKTWKETVSDLVALGLSQYYPQMRVHGLLHCGTREMQLTLLKTALLLGCRVQYGQVVMGVIDAAASASGDYEVWTLPSAEAGPEMARRDAALAAASGGATAAEAAAASSGSDDDGGGGKAAAGSAAAAAATDAAGEEVPAELALQPGEQDVSRLKKKSKVDYFEPAASQNGALFGGTEGAAEAPLDGAQRVRFDSLIVAEGEQSHMIRHLGFDRKVTRFKSAVGIVVNAMLPEDPKAPEHMLPEFVDGSGDPIAAKRLQSIGQDTGVWFENVEFMRGSTAFVAATVYDARGLAERGVLRNLPPKARVRELLTRENVDIEQLRVLGTKLAAACGIPAERVALAERNGVQIFDFSAKGRLTASHRLFQHDGTSAGVFVAGDALLNPFWPQGLGVNLGFHTGLDAVWNASILARDGPEAAEQEAHNALHIGRWTVGRWSLDKEPNPAAWNADPTTRYNRQSYVQYKMQLARDGGDNPEEKAAGSPRIALRPLPPRVVAALKL